MSNLYDASRQWSTRPDDERFESIDAMYKATRAYATAARTALAPLETLRVEAQDGDIKLVGKANIPAKLTHYSFGQLSRLAGAPPSYVRNLPATLAAQCVNHGLKKVGEERGTDKMQLLMHGDNGGLVTRAVTSDSYDRVWDYELVDRVNQNLVSEGWRVPPARPVRAGQKGTRKATAADILPNHEDFGLAVKVGDDIAPAGLYASDHDIFMFLVRMGEGIEDGQKLLNRGVFIQNSEVGDASLRFKFFVFDHVCGNMICWGASNVTEVSIRHIKGRQLARGNTLVNAMSRWNVLVNKLPNAQQLEADIKKARSYEIAASKEDVLDAVFKFAKTHGLDRLNKKVLEAGYDLAERTPRYGNPNTPWALTNGLTELSQQTGFTDERVGLDIQAGRILEMAF